MSCTPLCSPLWIPPGGIVDKGTKKHQVLKLQSCLILGLKSLFVVALLRVDELSGKGRERKTRHNFNCESSSHNGCSSLL